MSRTASEYRRATSAHITGLQRQIETLKQRVDQESVRAELAERRERSIAAERDIWKHQAREAHATLKSAGVRR